MKQQDKKIRMTVRKSVGYNPQLPKKEPTAAAPEPMKLNDIHTIGKRIKYFREKAGLEQKDIARQIGFTPNAISNWENGRTRPDITIVPTLCDILHITLYELCGVDNPMNHFSDKEQQMIEDYRGLSQGHQFAIDRMLEALKAVEYAENCPDLTELICCDKQLAAGFDCSAEFDDEGEPIFLYSSALIRQADYVFTVSGNSMEPEFHDGDRVLVQKYPGCPELQYGEVGAFIIGNNTYIKIYEKDGLHSYNEDYDTMTFGDDESVYMIGRVLGILDPEEIATEADITRFLAVHGSER